jgi:hypothetical protein
MTSNMLGLPRLKSLLRRESFSRRRYASLSAGFNLVVGVRTDVDEALFLTLLITQ